MLITFEGVDGSGKSTQISLLKNKLTESGYHVEVFREPGGTQVSELIRSILLNADLNVDPISELLLFSAARSQLISERVQPLLKENVIVILDRFYDSTVSYQGYGRKSLPIDKIHQINEIATNGLVPDVTFYMRLNLKEAAERIKNETKDRMEQSGDTFFKRVFEGFEELAAKEARFKTIDAQQGIEEIHQQIMDFLLPKLVSQQ